ncbi:hypothetical protein Bca4012_036931 [Brassica carinata]|uniref:Neprosin PEP catalytic domain-containing protein n=1 Tax=Brassica carinata TaxID=52824 RepID=A0A8X8BB12_BRACI|nr:hypothetical protein Bca52824_010621 [Brassica carinata]
METGGYHRKRREGKDSWFWPSRIFTDLAYNADDVFLGGELFTFPNTKSSSMGKGLQFMYEDPPLYAYACDCSVVAADNQTFIGVAEEINEDVSDIGWDYVRKRYIVQNIGGIL